jgi:hypothetical protein
VQAPSDLEKLKDGPLAIAAEAFRREKKRIDQEFYTKYSRYIQEGTWTESQYIDPDLYYYDAKKVSDQNAYPKTTYNISVIDVSSVDKYAAYKFKVGNRTYIEDPEFFGYYYADYGSQIGSVLTPVKKEVIVSEYKRSLDNPSKSTVTVKTYKNQFEDLFSKITATTQSLSNASGGYQRGANLTTNSGALKVNVLQNALNNNAWVIGSGAANQNVEWDSGNGITITDLKNSLLRLRLTSGGIAMTTDGGQSWINGINADGINTAMLTAGVINTEQIRIASPSRSGNTFIWDEDGIDAYSSQGADRYVRFCEYGLFGTTNGYALDQ